MKNQNKKRISGFNNPGLKDQLQQSEAKATLFLPVIVAANTAVYLIVMSLRTINVSIE
jgi:hypothetical protein